MENSNAQQSTISARTLSQGGPPRLYGAHFPAQVVDAQWMVGMPWRKALEPGLARIKNPLMKFG